MSVCISPREQTHQFSKNKRETTYTYRRRFGSSLQAQAASGHGMRPSSEEARPGKSSSGRGGAGESGGACASSKQHGRRSHRSGPGLVVGEGNWISSALMDGIGGV
jgi:hypothetical protein